MKPWSTKLNEKCVSGPEVPDHFWTEFKSFEVLKMRETNPRRERNQKRTRDRSSYGTNRDRGRFDDGNTGNRKPKHRNQKSTRDGRNPRTDDGTSRPPRPGTKPARDENKTSMVDISNNKIVKNWKMDEFDEKRAKYSTENMSPTELDRLTDINSDDFDPMAVLYTDKKFTIGKTHDCVSGLLRKWDVEDGTVVHKQETFKNKPE